MELLTLLRQSERVHVDPDRLAALCAEVGARASKAIFCRAMGELSLRLAAIEETYAAGNHVLLAKSARGIVGIAAEIGLASLASAAQNLASTAGRKDPAATAATLARLIRVGDRSQSEIWDFRDHSVRPR